MIERVAICLIAWLALLPTAARAENVAETRAMSALQGYEWSAADASRQLGMQADAELIAIATDPDTLSLYRQRARATLAEMRTEAALAHLTAALRSSGGVVERRRLVDALCHGFSEAEAARLEPLIVPLLEAEDAHLRVRAASCLLKPGFEGFDSAALALEKYQRRIQGTWEGRAAGLVND